MRNFIKLVENFNHGQPTVSQSEISKIEDAPSCIGNWVDEVVLAFDSQLGVKNMTEFKSLRDISYEPLKFKFDGLELFSVKLHDNSIMIGLTASLLEDSILVGLNSTVLEKLVEKISTASGMTVVGISDNQTIIDIFKSLNIPILI